MNKRITFILPGYPSPIGGFKVVYEYANYLTKHNFKVTVVHCLSLRHIKYPKNIIKFLKRIIGKIFVYYRRKKIDWIDINKNIKMIYLNEPNERKIPNADYIVASAWQTADYINEYSTIKGKKYYIIMDFPPYMGSSIDIHRTWNYNFKMISISSWIYDLVKNVNNNNNLINIPIGVSENIFKNQKEIVNDSNLVLAMFSSGKYKGSKDLIKSFEIAKKKNIKLNFNLFGKENKPKNLPSWIHYHKRLSKIDLVNLMNRCGIFVSSSLAEGFGLPSAEALLCGCSLATTDCGGNRDFAIHNKTALVSKINDPEALAYNILKLNSDNELRTKLSKNGIKLLKGFTWENSRIKFNKFILNE